MTSLPKNNSFYLKGIILLFMAGALSACHKKTVYHTFHSLPTEGWQQKDTLLFNVEIPDSQTYYKLYVEVRNRNNYPYQNINLFVKYTSPDSLQLPADTLMLTLADKGGIWKGEGWGGLYQSSFPAGSIRVSKAGTYLFKIAYTLPDKVLNGINDIGIKLERL